MTQQSRTTLDGYFNTGDTPTEAQFQDLIDSTHNITDDGTAQIQPSEGAFANGDKTKLDGIETGATADQSAAEIAAMSQDWRGVGAETLITATAALEAASSSGVSDGDKGDITVSGSGATWTVDDEAITLAKMAHIATDSFLGRDTAGTGDVEVLSASAVRGILNVEDGADVTDATNVAAAGAMLGSNNLSDVSNTATARGNIALGTANTPQFTGLDLGGTDCTITRVSSGVLAIEGSNILKASDLGATVQGHDAGLASIAGLTTVADRMIYTTASDTYAVATLTSKARSILAQSSDATVRNEIGLGAAQSPQFASVSLGNDDTTLARVSAGDVSVEGNLVYRAGGTDVPVTDGGTGASTASAARTNLGVAIGTDVQAFDADTLKADVADQLTAGFTSTTDDDGAAASPYTPDPATSNYKRLTNDGAMTINPPTMASGESCSMVILLTNTTGAGAITFGTTVSDGDAIGTTTTDEYLIFITAVDVGGTTYSNATVKALQ